MRRLSASRQHISQGSQGGENGRVWSRRAPHSNSRQCRVCWRASFAQAECGTSSGYRRHLRVGEATCDRCRAVRNAQHRAYLTSKAPLCRAGCGERVSTPAASICSECRRKGQAARSPKWKTVGECGHPVKYPGAKRCGDCHKAGWSECGTRSGYEKHRRNGEQPCQACREAVAAAKRQSLLAESPDQRARRLARMRESNRNRRHPE